MMRRLYTFALILLLAVNLLTAEPTAGEKPAIDPTKGLSSYVPTEPYTEFTIKAYKNTPDPVKLTVYDALTAALDEMTEKHTTIMITPFLQAFLGDNITSIRSPSDQILFSYIVTGASTGSFETTVTVSRFTGPYTPTTPATETPKGKIDAFYKLGEVDYLFSKSQTNQNDIYEIIGDPAPADGLSTVEAAEGKVSFSVRWVIKQKGASAPGSKAEAIGEYWMATGAVMMQINKSDFENSSTGDYRATVEVKLAPVV